MSTCLPCRFWKFGLYYMKWWEARFPSNSKRLPIPLERGTVSSTSEKLLNFITSVLVGSINLYSLVGVGLFWQFFWNAPCFFFGLKLIWRISVFTTIWLGCHPSEKHPVFCSPPHNFTPGPGCPWAFRLVGTLHHSRGGCLPSEPGVPWRFDGDSLGQCANLMYPLGN